MPRHDRGRQTNSRARIASAAARLIAESGITDYGMAKKKAVRQLGLPEGSHLPDNAEVEAELRAYQDLYLGEEQAEHVRELREIALEVMELLERFRPYLTGSVLDGTAGPFAEVEILLFADSAKEVEIFLLNEGIAFEAGDTTDDRFDAVLLLQTEEAQVRLTVLAPNFERVTFRGRDGRVRERVRTDGLRELLEQNS